MLRLAFILLFVASIFCLGCRTFHPEVRAMYQKYSMIKRGMTYSQVYAILPQTGMVRLQNGTEMETWSFERNIGDGVDVAFLQVIFGTDERVHKVNRFIHHESFSAPVFEMPSNRSNQN